MPPIPINCSGFMGTWVHLRISLPSENHNSYGGLGVARPPGRRGVHGAARLLGGEDPIPFILQKPLCLQDFLCPHFLTPIYAGTYVHGCFLCNQGFDAGSDPQNINCYGFLCGVRPCIHGCTQFWGVRFSAMCTVQCLESLDDRHVEGWHKSLRARWADRKNSSNTSTSGHEGYSRYSYES